MSNKILAAVFVVLFVVVVGEVGYFFYSAKNQPKVIIPPENQSIPSPSPLLSKNSLLTEQNIRFLASITRNPNQKLIIKTETQGFVGGISDYVDKKHVLFKIVDEKENELMTYLWLKEKSDDLHFYLVNGDNQTPIFINDIKTNDKIKVTDEDNIRDHIVVINVFVYR